MRQQQAGVPAAAQYGRAAPKPRPASGGIPAGAMGIGPKPPPPKPRCGLPTKDGASCQAWPVKGTLHCAGHNRQIAALTQEVEAA